jgi:hypothetical protein
VDPEAEFSNQEIELSRGRHIDNMLIPPALDLIKDHGIYLMSNGIPVQRESCGRKSKVAYAKGFNPFDDLRWEEYSKAYLGRKDFSLPVPLRWIRRAQARKQKVLCLVIDKNGLRMK